MSVDADLPPAAPVAFRGGGFARRGRSWVGAVAVVVALLLWQVVATARGDFTFLPSPADVTAAFVELARSGELMRDVAASLGRVVPGWCIGACCGLALGLAIGLFPLARAAAMPLVSALFATPKIALLPLFVVWLGIGEPAKIATIAIGVFSPMVFATVGGVDGIDRGLLRMAQSFGLPTHAIVRKIVLPGALPSLLTGVRVSTSIAIVLLTGAEMIAAEHGIGALALKSGNLMRTDRLLVAVGLLACFGLMLSFLIGAVERVFLRWR